MDTRWAVLAMLVIGASVAGEGSAQVTDSAATAEAQRFIELLQAGEWAAAEQMVEPAVRDRLGAALLETAWGQVSRSLGEGKVTRVHGVSVLDTQTSVELYGDFARDTVLVRVVLSPGLKVSGFWIAPVPAAARPSSPGPPYGDEAMFREHEIRIGAEPWLLPGTLTVPVDGGPHPAVVLVHGSGPHDRDETVGGTKVFRDLAWGLAARGVAVLRYEKRTKVHGARMGPGVTVEAEVIEDALAALESVRAQPGVDAERVYLAGHSLGGQLAPEIARRDGRVAGAIMLAASARQIGAVMEEQLEYLAGLPENTGAETRAQLRAAQEQVRWLRSGEAPDSAMIMGAPASYFRDLERRDAVAEALRLDIPLLLLQGERDYQVTMADFEIWRAATAQRPATSLESFPELNHLFVAGSGRATPAEYAQPGFVAEQVIATIVRWIGSQ